MTPAEANAQHRTELHQLEATLAMLKRQNVAKYTDVAGGGFTVEFFPTAAPAPKHEEQKQDKTVDPASGLPLCKCGHLTAEHGPQGDCLKLCSIEQCAPEEPK